ncbi:MAG: FAD:protein FMN transferase [Caldilineaceae bacterium]
MDTSLPVEFTVWPTYSFRAMGSQISLWVESSARAAQTAFAAVEQLFATHERTLSRFDPASELSTLNRSPNQWLPVSPLLWSVLTWALELAAQTDGLFDPTLLNAVEAAGYTRSFELLEADRAFTPMARQAQHRCLPSTAAGQKGGWQAIQLDGVKQAVKLPAGVRLDFGGIGKGYTAQRAVELLSQWGACLVDAGGDIVAGVAPQGLPGWPVAVAAPSTLPAITPGAEVEAGSAAADEPTAPDLLELWLAEAALATSGVDYRRWRQAGRVRHHLIDPRTGEPAVTDVVTASILATEATVAEAWAKAALLLGMREGIQQLTEHQMAGLLAAVDGEVALTPVLADYVGVTV